MEVTFKKLIPELAEEYLQYFDTILFTDHEEYSACYCLESHLSRQEDKAYDNREARRSKAKEMIEEGIMNGYLVYDGKDVIGWCNVGDKLSYQPLLDEAHKTVSLEDSKVKSIYCYAVAPAYRGKGITHIILKKLCSDAKEEGYDYVEGYPFLDQAFTYQFHGPLHLYEANGFTRVADREWFCIMSKRL